MEGESGRRRRGVGRRVAAGSGGAGQRRAARLPRRLEAQVLQRGRGRLEEARRLVHRAPGRQRRRRARAGRVASRRGVRGARRGDALPRSPVVGAPGSRPRRSAEIASACQRRRLSGRDHGNAPRAPRRATLVRVDRSVRVQGDATRRQRRRTRRVSPSGLEAPPERDWRNGFVALAPRLPLWRQGGAHPGSRPRQRRQDDHPLCVPPARRDRRRAAAAASAPPSVAVLPNSSIALVSRTLPTHLTSPPLLSTPTPPRRPPPRGRGRPDDPDDRLQRRDGHV